MVDLREVQSMVVCPSEPAAMDLVFLHCENRDALRLVLEAAFAQVTVAATFRPDQPSVNVGLTGAGALLAGLGPRTYAALPDIYLHGMRNAAPRLGDPDPLSDDPATAWDPMFGPGSHPVHVVAIAVAADRQPGQQAGVVAADLTGLQLVDGVADEVGRWTGTRRGGYEPFGFRDGLSDPVIEGSGRRVTAGNGVWDPAMEAWRAVRSGEAVLGYVDESGVLAGHPDAAHVERDGSYLVIRKLEQDVDAFWEACKGWADELNLCSDLGPGGLWTADDVAEAMVGRHKDGRVLGQPVGASPANDFLYRRPGACPVAASPASHIRRANPRDDIEAAEHITKRHLMFRRAIPYDDPSRKDEPGHTQGLIFLAACADLRRQFEFVQADWLQGGDRLGFGPEPDALSGRRDPDSADDRRGAASIGGIDGRRHRELALANYVTLRGGEYVLLPSKSALKRIATWGPTP